MPFRNTCDRLGLTFFVIAAFFATGTGFAQEWMARLPFVSTRLDETAAVCTDDSHLFLAGSVLNPSGNWDVVVACLDNAGDTVWTREYDLGGDEKAVQILLDQHDGIVIAFTQWINNGSLAYVARWTTTGSEHWRRAFADGINRTSAAAIALTGSGNVVIAFSSEGLAGNRCGVSSVTANGALEWEEFISDETPISLDTEGNSIAVAAKTNSNPAQSCFNLFDGQGRLIAAHQYNGGGVGAAVPVRLRSGVGGFFLGGNILAADASGIPFVLHYSFTGTRLWLVLPVFATGQHRLTDIQPFPGGGAVITAREQSHTQDADIYLARLAPDGSSVWAQNFDRTGSINDVHPPLFAGVTGARQEGMALVVTWPHARDDVSTPDEIRYNVYVADSLRTYDYQTPTIQTTGGSSAILTVFEPGQRYYIVVRAVDQFGNEDANMREIAIQTSVRPPIPPLASDIFTHGRDVPDVVIPATAEKAAADGPQTVSIPSLPAPQTRKDPSPTAALPESGTPPKGETARSGNRDPSAAAVHKQLRAPERLMVLTNLTLPGGVYRFSSVRVESAATLMFDGPVTLFVEDSLLVDGSVSSNGGDILIMDFSSVLIRGSINNRRYGGSSFEPGNITFVSDHGSIEIRNNGPGEGIHTDGNLSMIPVFKDKSDDDAESHGQHAAGTETTRGSEENNHTVLIHGPLHVGGKIQIDGFSRMLLDPDAIAAIRKSTREGGEIRR